MIRNRSQNMLPSNCNDIESGNPSSTRTSTRQMSSLWKWTFYLFILSFIGYMLVLVNSPSPLKEHKRPTETSFEQLTIVLNTFKRHDMMIDAVQHYSQCPLVSHIYIVWSEKEKPPADIVAKYEGKQHPVVTFRIEEIDSLNTRFKPISGAHNDAILSVDDDMRIPCEDLNLAYDVWRGSPRSIVGWMPRIHLRRNGLLEYRCWWRVWWHSTYSIILTKAAILHHDFFAQYWTQDAEHQAVRDFVDKRRNCEDIAMQFLIANVTRLPPIYVHGHLGDLGALGGISTNQDVIHAGHMQERSDCLNQLEKLYGKLPLVPSHIVVNHAENGWINAPSTWYEYLSSDLWKW